MGYFKVLAGFKDPATAKEVYDKALAEFPSLMPKNVQVVRAALAYLVRTGKARRIGHGKYSAVTTDRDQMLKMVMEVNQLRDKLSIISKAIYIANQMHGPKDGKP